MVKQIFVNLPVKDVAKSTEFFAGLGFRQNKDFSDENASSMMITEDIVVMLLAEPFFKTFTNKAIADAATTEAIIALGVESRQEVDELCDKALASGGGKANEPQDHGFMYGRSFTDPDGHLWEVTYVDLSAMPQ